MSLDEASPSTRPILTRGPSVYQGAEEKVVAEVRATTACQISPSTACGIPIRLAGVAADSISCRNDFCEGRSGGLLKEDGKL